MNYGLLCLLLSANLCAGWMDERPVLESIDGNLIISSAKDRNITLHTVGNGYITVNDIDLLHVATTAKSASSLVQRWRDGYMQELHSQVMRLMETVEGPNGLAKRMSSIDWTGDSTTNTSNFRTPKPPSNGGGGDSSVNSVADRVRKVSARLRTVVSKLRANHCSSNPCQNGGTCIRIYDDFQCICPSSWEGFNCATDVNECAKFLGTDLGCQNGATCTNLPGSFLCGCAPGWHGIHCTTKATACSAESSHELCGHGVCIAKPGTPLGYTCLCDQGWKSAALDPSCTIDVDECAANHPPCSTDPAVPCINVPGSYYCGGCPQGYTGNGYYCTDIDECIVDNGGCSTVPKVDCINTRGSRTCGPCPPGYHGNGMSCVFVGACRINNGGCHPLATCIESPSFTNVLVECRCPAGYQGSGMGPQGCQENPTTACASNPCSHGSCVPSGNSFTCRCEAGYSGPTCSSTINLCSPNPCKNNGSCRSSLNAITCECTAAFQGPRCETPKEACGGVIRDPAGTLTYPSSSSTYRKDLSCAFIIYTNASMVLNVTFTKFDLESTPACRHDFLQIHDGGNAASHQLGRFCGSKLPLDGHIITTHNSIYLWLNTDDSDQRSGFSLHWNSIQPVCGGQLTAEHGTISSPGSPGRYSPNRDCLWNIAVRPGKRIQFHFFAVMFEIHPKCNMDYLEINETVSDRNQQLGLYCNHTHPPPLVTSGSFATVHFHSDDKGQDLGFQLTYSSIEGSPGCGGVFSGEQGFISSPTIGSSYENNMLCEWKIRLPVGEKIQLYWISMDIERSGGDSCRYDYVKVFEGPDEDSPLIGRYCGDSLPPSRVINSNEALIIFSSDYTIAGAGFKLKYETHCGGEFHEPSGIIKSPYYPNNYPASRMCVYRIIQPPGKAIVLKFIDMDIEGARFVDCYYDRLEIRDGDNENSTSLADLCGDSDSIPSEPFFSSHNYLYLKFITDSSLHNRGFLANYTTVDRRCGGLLREPGITIQSPGGLDGYDNAEDCTWDIQAPPGHVIQLKFTSFNLESQDWCDNDYVEVNEEYRGNTILIGKYCGTKNPPILTSQGSTMTVKFKTDNTITSDGFTADYTFIDAKNFCGSHYFTQHGVITSPGYPESYPRNRECVWIIEAPNKKRIVLEVKKFELESHSRCAFDYVEIRNGGHETSPLIGKFCGTNIPTPIESFTNQLYVKFQSDSSLGGPGFEIEWSATVEGCGGTLTESSGDIMSPYYPQVYAQSSECTWKIAVAAGSRIQIIFVDFDMEHHVRCRFDYLEISEGFDGRKKNINRYCGSSPPSPPSIELKSNLVTIRFRSDYSNSGRGFFIKYNTICNNMVHGHSGVIESPNFPENYPPNMNCTWIIDAPKGNKLNLTFSHFELERMSIFYSDPNTTCSEDFLNVQEGSGDHPNTELGKFCGTVPLPMKIASGQNQVFLNFVTDSLLHFGGFRLEWILNGCGGHLTRPEGVITSPNYPLPYPTDIVCEWLIEVDYGHSVEIDFQEISTEKTSSCSYDKVKLYGGDDADAPELAEFCFSIEPVTYTSTTNRMFIKFESDPTVSGHGFHATYKAVPLTCGGRFVADQGFIHSPNYPQNYPHNQNCEWLIEVDQNHVVNLTFTDFDIEDTTNCTDDYVKVFDGPSRENAELGSFCQSQLPTTLLSTGNKVLVVLRTDSLISAKGFKAQFNRECGARIIVNDNGELTTASNLHLRVLDEIVNCTWILTAANLEDHITLTFYHMDLPDSDYPDYSDRLTVYEGEGTDGTPVGSWNGHKVPPPIVSKGNTLTVHLFSNYSNELVFGATYSVLNSACGGDYHSESGTLASPGYPNSYPINAECVWILHTAPGNKIELTFSMFDIEQSPNCDRDYLEIRYDSAVGELLNTFCGTEIDSISSSKKLWIKFRSDEIGTARGFLAEYTFKHGNDLNGVAGEIASPLFPYPFKKSVEVTWRITVDFGFSVRIEFNEFHLETYLPDTECSYDSGMMIYDGYDDDAPLLKELCGMAIPDPIQSTSNIVFITFDNNKIREGNWFLLRWYQVPRESNYGENTVNALSKCNEEISLTDFVNATHYFSSPGWPTGYEPNLDCNWVFTSPPGTHLVLRLLFLDLEESINCLDDHVAVYSGFVMSKDLPPQAKLLGQFCRANDSNSYVDAGNVMTVKFISDVYINKTGFRALVYRECGGEMSGPNGEIEFNDTVRMKEVRSWHYNCEWNITVRPGRTIEVKIEKLSIESNEQICGEHYLMLKNGGGPDSPLLGIGKFCGHDLPPTLKTTGNKLHVKVVGSGSHVQFSLTYREIGLECGGTFQLSKTQRRIEFSSPNYPNIPSPYSECFWTFMAPAGERLSIHFIERFDLTNSDGCVKEYIEIRDGGTDSSKLLGQFCHDEAPSSLSTTGNILYAHFYTDVSDPRNGFKAVVTSGDICGGILRGKSGAIVSRNYPNQYPNNEGCFWLIIAPPDHTLKIEFRDIHLPGIRLCKNTDHVTISERTPDNSTGQEIGSYCGTTKPPIIETSFNEATVTFSSTRRTFLNYRGFSLTFKATRDACSGSLTGMSGQFKSRGYPNPNSKPLYCEWHITVPEGNQVQVEIEDLDIGGMEETTTHGFHLVFHNDFKSKSVITIIKNGDYPKTVSSSSRFMMVSYWSSSGHRGLKATYRAAAPAPCGGNVDNLSGSLSAPTAPPFDQSSFYCQWSVKAPEQFTSGSSNNSQTLTITVTGNIGRYSRQTRACSYYLKNIIISDTHGDVGMLCGNATQQPFIVRSPSSENTVKILNGTYGAVMKFDLQYKWQQCGGIISGPSHVIKAPANVDFPRSCAWRVSFPDNGEVIRMTFNRLNVGACDKGYIIVRNGGPFSPEVGKFCGNMNPHNITSSSNKLWIEYFAAEAPGDFEFQLDEILGGCGGAMRGSSREIMSPSFPSRYPNNAECTWEITSEPGYHVGLSFVERFNLETSELCKNDFVEILEWNNSESGSWKSLGKVCGRNIPPAFNATSNRMKVIFQSNNEIQGDGFRAIWEQNCGGIFMATKYRQIIESPNYPNYYARNLVCNYTIIAPDKMSVLVEFNEFDLESDTIGCRYDNVTIHANHYGWELTESTHCGKDKPPVQMSTDKITIIFKSDMFVQKRGFQFSYFINECGGEIREEQLLEPPTSKAAEYFGRFNCTWIIRAPVDKNVVLRFTLFQLEYTMRCFADRLEAFEGTHIEAKSGIALLCGDLSESLPVIKSKGNTMTVNFFADDSLNFAGFKANVLFTKSITAGCGGHINLTKSTTWKSQQGSMYENFEDCLWTIQAASGKNVRMTVTEMDVKNTPNKTVTVATAPCNGDYIEIRDGRGPFAELIGRFCGNRVFEPITSTVNVLWIRFVSDGEFNGSGVTANLEVIDSPCGEPIISLTNSSHTVTSPGYPGDYPLGIKCKWIVKSSRERDIHVHLRDIDMEDDQMCHGDHLQITDKMNNKHISQDFGEDFIYSGKRRERPRMRTRLNPVGSYSYCSKFKEYDYYSGGNELEITLKSTFENPEKPRKFKFDVSIADCNRNYTSKQGRIIHQGFNDCWITIIVPANRTISLYFNSLMIYDTSSCPTSFLKIFDGGFNDPLLGTYCGMKIPEPLFSTGNKLSLHSTSNRGISWDNYDITYTSTDQGRGCGGKIYNYAGRFTSPMYPQNYRNESNCVWDIIAPRGFIIVLDFVIFDLGSNHDSCSTDYVDINETSDSSSHYTSRYCAAEKPAPYRSHSNEISVKYVTSINNGGNGWVISFLAVERSYNNEESSEGQEYYAIE